MILYLHVHVSVFVYTKIVNMYLVSYDDDDGLIYMYM